MISKTLLILVCISTVVFAASKEEVIDLYQAKDYREACRKAGDIYNQNNEDEEFLSMYAHACLESDMINRMILPIIKLHATPEGRENAAYFSTILYQKKLLYHALVDDIDISYVNLPQTEYILSKIFNRFVSGDYDYKNGSYWFNDKNDDTISYSLSTEEHQNTMKIFLRTYKNGKIDRVRTYW